MEIYYDNPSENSGETTDREIGKPKYIHLFCDHCGAKHPEVCVNNLYKEEGYEEDMDLCWDCQKLFYRPELRDKEAICEIYKEDGKMRFSCEKRNHLLDKYSVRFIQQILDNTHRFFGHPRPIEVLLESGYAQEKKGKIWLEGYPGAWKFMDNLDEEDLRKYILILMNAMHQAAYLVHPKVIDDFIEFSQERKGKR